MTAPADCDAIIVGAGLAGLVATHELARAGHHVLLVDVKTAVERPVHTTGIFVRRTLQDFDVPEDCLGPAVRRVVLHSPGGRRHVMTSERDEFRVGRMGRLYGRLLAEAEAAGAEWLPGTRFRSAAAVDGGVAVWLERGGARWRRKARLLIGADGAVSRVARELGLDRNREWLVGLEDVYEGGLAPGSMGAFHCVLDPRIAPGYIGWVVDDGEGVHVGVAGYADRFDPQAALAAMRRRVLHDPELRGVADLRRMERRGGRIPVNGILARIGCDRGLLLGDAAGAVSPLTAGGLDPCYRLTRLAVRMVCRVLEGKSPELLAAYSGRPFQRYFIRRRLMRRALGAIEHPAAAELVCALLRLPGLSWLGPHVFFGRGSFPDVDLAVREERRAAADPEGARVARAGARV